MVSTIVNTIANTIANTTVGTVVSIVVSKRTGMMTGLRGATLSLALLSLAQLSLATPAHAQLAGAPAGAKTAKLNDKIRANQVEWLSDAPMEKIKGTAAGVQGSFTIDPAKLDAISGSASFAVADMKSGNATRDRHLKGKEWLDAEAFPRVTFSFDGAKVIKVEGDKASLEVRGTMELHGVKQAMTVPVTVTWKAASADTARVPGDWVKIDTKFEVKLADYKIKGKEGVVGDKVGTSIAISATLYAHTVAP